MNKNGLHLPLILAGLFLGACESYSPSKEDIGMATGAFLGSRIGRKMDQNDQKKTAEALETSREGSATSWRNPDTGQTYSVTPTYTYQGAAGPCRHFRAVTQIDGDEEVVQGTACRQKDGTWKAA